MKKLFLFLCLTAFTLNIAAQNADIELLRKINNIQQTKGYSTFISETTSYFGAAVPVIMSGVALIEKNDQLLKDGIYVFTAQIVVSGLLTYSLKQAVDRPRPAVTYPDLDAYRDLRRHSFPSGHTSQAFSTATALTLKYPKWYVVVPSYAWACSVGYSRMNLGVHYPSDVLAGAAIGAGSAYITYIVNEWFWKKRENKKLLSEEYFL